MVITDDGQVTANWWTYLIKGPHKNVFIMPAKMDDTDG
jgi:hypothetical protein